MWQLRKITSWNSGIWKHWSSKTKASSIASSIASKGIKGNLRWSFLALLTVVFGIGTWKYWEWRGMNHLRAECQSAGRLKVWRWVLTRNVTYSFSAEMLDVSTLSCPILCSMIFHTCNSAVTQISQSRECCCVLPSKVTVHSPNPGDWRPDLQKSDLMQALP